MTIFESTPVCITDNQEYFAPVKPAIYATIYKLLPAGADDWAVRIRLSSAGNTYYDFRTSGIDSTNAERTTNAMLNVLEHFRSNTCANDMEQVISDIIVLDEQQVHQGLKSQNALLPHDCYELQTLRSLQPHDSIPSDLLEWMEKEYNYTITSGGICVPYHNTTAPRASDTITTSRSEDGFIEIVFASNQYPMLNTPTCIALFKAIQCCLKMLQPETQHRAILSKLNGPILEHYLSLLNIQEFF